MEGDVIIMEQYFYKEAVPSHVGQWIIKVDYDKLPILITYGGSYNVFPARLYGLSYANYLRLCRDEYGAKLRGKNTRYPLAFFDNEKQIDLIISDLNARANLVMFEREHPDWRGHDDEMRRVRDQLFSALKK